MSGYPERPENDGDRDEGGRGWFSRLRARIKRAKRTSQYSGLRQFRDYYEAFSWTPGWSEVLFCPLRRSVFKKKAHAESGRAVEENGSQSLWSKKW